VTMAGDSGQEKETVNGSLKDLRKITKEKYPRIEYTRRMINDGANYYGPFVWGSIKKNQHLIQKLFGLRTCKNLNACPCLQSHIRMCYGPKLEGHSQDGYLDRVKQAKLFLKGKNKVLMKELEEKMQKESDKMEFERAAKIRDQINSIKKVLEAQYVRLSPKYEMDVLYSQRVYCYDPDSKAGEHIELVYNNNGVEKVENIKVAIQKGRTAMRYSLILLMVRQGSLIASKRFNMDVKMGEDEQEIISQFMGQYYSQATPPKEIVVPLRLENQDVIRDALSERVGRKVDVTLPQRGIKHEMLKMAKRNLMLILQDERYRLFNKQRARPWDEISKYLMKNLDIESDIKVVYGFDISNLGSSGIVGAGVCFFEGEPFKSGYRRFKMKTISKQDDPGSMNEVVERFIAKWGKNDEVSPDLILIDGGPAQVGAAMAAVEAKGIDIPIVGLAKKDELLFTGKSFASRIVLARNDPALLFLMRVRDEAHRFTKAYQVNTRKKSLKSVIDLISDVGPERRKMLLRYFGSLKRIKAASVMDLQQVKGIGPELAEHIFNELHEEEK